MYEKIKFGQTWRFDKNLAAQFAAYFWLALHLILVFAEQTNPDDILTRIHSENLSDWYSNISKNIDKDLKSTYYY